MAAVRQLANWFVQLEEGKSPSTKHSIIFSAGRISTRSTIIALDTNIVLLLLVFAKPVWETTCIRCQAILEMHQDCRQGLEVLKETQKNGEVDLVVTETVVWEVRRHGFVGGYDDGLLEEVGVRVVEFGLDSMEKVQEATTQNATTPPSWTDHDINDFRIYLEVAALAAAENDNEVWLLTQDVVFRRRTTEQHHPFAKALAELGLPRAVRVISPAQLFDTPQVPAEDVGR